MGVPRKEEMKEQEPQWSEITEQDFRLRLKTAIESHMEQINQLENLWQQYLWGKQNGYITRAMEAPDGNIAVSLEEKSPIGFK
jgi:hypothetical protein